MDEARIQRFADFSALLNAVHSSMDEHMETKTIEQLQDEHLGDGRDVRLFVNWNYFDKTVCKLKLLR